MARTAGFLDCLRDGVRHHLHMARPMKAENLSARALFAAMAMQGLASNARVGSQLSAERIVDEAMLMADILCRRLKL